MTTNPIPDHPLKWCHKQRTCPWHSECPRRAYSMTIDISVRYVVVGIYKDRRKPIWRIYPIPFVRISIERLHP